MHLDFWIQLRHNDAVSDDDYDVLRLINVYIIITYYYYNVDDDNDDFMWQMLPTASDRA